MNPSFETSYADLVARMTPCGATIASDGTCRWRVWAPHVHEVQLLLFDAEGRRTLYLMNSIEDEYFEFQASFIKEGQRYAYQLDWKDHFPDPASRWQPDGVHQPSAVWSQQFIWSDHKWRGIARKDLVLYELHVGTFTSEGTFAAILHRVQELRNLGVTAIELMPVAQFPGRKNWGHDGTYWYAVQNTYGCPRELQRLVNACHYFGMAVFLDVNYDHLGPEGNFLAEFGPYLSQHVQSPLGLAVNFDEPGSDEVRAFVLHNVQQWIRDFHIDGLYLNSAHALQDRSEWHILAEIQAVADEEADKLNKQVQIIADNKKDSVRS